MVKRCVLVVMVFILVLPGVFAADFWGARGDFGSDAGVPSTAQNLDQLPPKAAELCQQSMANAIAQCRDSGFEGWDVIRDVYYRVDGKTVVDLQDVVIGSYPCSPPETLVDESTGEWIKHKVYSEFIDYSLHTQAVSTERNRNYRKSGEEGVWCNFLCSGWNCPVDISEWDYNHCPNGGAHIDNDFPVGETVYHGETKEQAKERILGFAKDSCAARGSETVQCGVKQEGMLFWKKDACEVREFPNPKNPDMMILRASCCCDCMERVYEPAEGLDDFIYVEPKIEDLGRDETLEEAQDRMREISLIPVTPADGQIKPVSVCYDLHECSGQATDMSEDACATAISQGKMESHCSQMHYKEKKLLGLFGTGKFTSTCTACGVPQVYVPEPLWEPEPIAEPFVPEPVAPPVVVDEPEEKIPELVDEIPEDIPEEVEEDVCGEGYYTGDSSCAGECKDSQACTSKKIKDGKHCYYCKDECDSGEFYGNVLACQSSCESGKCKETTKDCYACAEEEQLSCAQICESLGDYTDEQVSFKDYIMSEVNSKTCVDGASISYQNGIQSQGCTCYPTTNPSISFGGSLSCDTECGQVACGDSATCSCGDDCTVTVHCTWGGWDWQGSEFSGGPVPVLGE